MLITWHYYLTIRLWFAYYTNDQRQVHTLRDISLGDFQNCLVSKNTICQQNIYTRPRARNKIEIKISRACWCSVAGVMTPSPDISLTPYLGSHWLQVVIAVIAGQNKFHTTGFGLAHTSRYLTCCEASLRFHLWKFAHKGEHRFASLPLGFCDRRVENLA